MATTYDIYFQIVPADQQLGQKFFRFGTQAAQAVAGPAKLMNRWVKCLLTTKGSDLNDLSYGTGFSDLLGSNIASLSDLADAISLFVDDCNQQIYALDRLAMPPPEERLLSATVTDIVQVNDDGVEVYVLIKNQAGVSFQFALPAVPLRG